MGALLLLVHLLLSCSYSWGWLRVTGLEEGMPWPKNRQSLALPICC